MVPPTNHGDYHLTRQVEGMGALSPGLPGESWLFLRPTSPDSATCTLTMATQCWGTMQMGQPLGPKPDTGHRGVVGPRLLTNCPEPAGSWEGTGTLPLQSAEQQLGALPHTADRSATLGLCLIFCC